ncbi:class I adenylate-forming enzyme family protein [Dactylosporangium sp. NPDC005572]|uniref:class I adenylate-forming enzyme family protein n=1 Tax=Dactylosporangium sp. NPDC005572 TaxID=3156889 RepID=UPI0033A7F529
MSTELGGVAVRAAVRVAGTDVAVGRDELAGLARRAAHGLRRRFAPGERVALCVDGTPETIAGLLGCWLAGLDVLLAEPGSSYLADARPDVRAVLGPGDIAFAEERPLPPVDPPRVLQFTSGSTGEPKLAVQPLEHILRGGELYRDLHGLTAGSVIVAPLPLAHSFGLGAGLAAALAGGATLVTMPRLNLRSLAALLAGDPAPVLLGTPLLYSLLAQARPAPLPRPATLLTSGGPMPADVVAATTAWNGRPPWQCYGSTETGLICAQHERDLPWHPDGVGSPVPGARIAVADDGLLHVTTDTMFDGYLGEPPRTAPAFATGDAGRLEDGELRLLGRKSTFINVGGRKVNPARLERVVREAVPVRDVVAYGVAVRTGDEEVHLAVVGAEPDRVMEACRRRLSPHELPRAVHVLPELPRGPLGKVDRGRLPRPSREESTT